MLAHDAQATEGVRSSFEGRAASSQLHHALDHSAVRGLHHQASEWLTSVMKESSFEAGRSYQRIATLRRLSEESPHASCDELEDLDVSLVTQRRRKRLTSFSA